MRGHKPIVIEEFNGLWKRGEQDSTPLDHFTDCNNIQYTESGFETRDGIDPYLPYGDVVRIYSFNQSLLVLDSHGNLFHTDRGALSFTPILSIATMTDFAFVKYANHAYITPIGPQNDYIYVYTYGSSSPARKAAGFAPTTAPVAANSATAGNVEEGIHIFAVAYETDTGFITPLGPGVQLNVPAPGNKSVDLSSIPISGNTAVVARWIVTTKLIDPEDFTGNLEGYQFFLLARIGDNTTTTLTVNFFDAELLEDASELEDLYEEIPNSTGLGLFHGRLIAWNFPQGNAGELISTVRVSYIGEPEAINQVSGLFSLPLDGKPITYCQEYRDILHCFKSTKTVAVADNGDVPSSWPQTIIDEGIGAGGNHAVATIMDSGGVNIEFLLVAHYAGISLFDGTYRNPALTYKIYDLWKDTIGDDRSEFNRVQLVVNSFDQIIYVVTPAWQMLIGDFKNGLDPKAIKWAPWTFNVEVTTICIIEEPSTIKLIIGSRRLVP